MSGKQAKILTTTALASVLRHIASNHRHPGRDQAIVLLSAKAGLRAGEISKLTWPMVLDPRQRLANAISLHDSAAKCGGGRLIPIHHDLRQALLKLRRGADPTGPVILSERGCALTPSTISNWFAALYRAVGLTGCTSHSGRRTFITIAARNVHRAGGSLRDVQLMAGHKSIDQTQSYIEGDTAAQRRLVRLL